MSRQLLHGVRVLSALQGTELFGHERGNIEVYKALRDMGAEVVIGYNNSHWLKTANAVHQELTDLGFPTFPLRLGIQWSKQWVVKHPQLLVTQPASVARCSYTFWREIERFRPTHVHLGSPMIYSFIAPALALTRVPLVYRMGDCPPIDSKFNLLIWKAMCRRTCQIVTNSRYVASQVTAQGISKHRLSTIYNLAPQKTVARSEAVSPPNGGDRLPILYVGQVSEQKGLLPLVEAFSRIQRKFPQAVLWIVGKSAYDDEFQASLRAKIHRLGCETDVVFAGHTDPTPWYQRAVVHVVPSLYVEAAPNVVLEAKREGLPSVVFPTGGLPELIDHRVNGYVCPGKTADHLDRGITELLQDPDTRRAMAAAAKADYAANYGPDRFRRAWATVYQAALNRSEGCR